MSNLEHDAARDQLSELVAGAAPKTYDTAAAMATDLKDLSERAKKLFEDMTGFYNAAKGFVIQKNPSIETLCGMLKHVRMIGDAANLVEKLCETQQKPISLRSLIETLLTVKSHIRGHATGEYSTKVYGFHFIPGGKATPAIPGRNQPEDRKRFFEWLRNQGLGGLIYEEVPYTALAQELTRMLETAPQGGTPWPDWVKVYVAPSVAMKALPSET